MSPVNQPTTTNTTNPDHKELADIEANVPPQQPHTIASNAAAAPGTTTTTTTTTTTKVHRAVTLLDWTSLNILLGFFALMVMVASAKLPITTDRRSYQVACGAVSLALAIITALLALCNQLENELARKIISAFQFLWWVAGVIVLTFFGSFQTTAIANGYFGAWFAFFFASLMLFSAFPLFEHKLDKAMHSPRKPLLFLIVASAVVMGASIDPCSPQYNCYEYNGWAVSMSSISLIVAIILFIAADKLSATAMKYISLFLVLWWAVGTLVVTFGAPFVTTGNGYFFSYAAFIASVGLFRTSNYAQPEKH